MPKKEKLVEQITSRDEDFAVWYTDVVKKAELCDYSSVKGFVVLRPYAYALWENIQSVADKMFKDTGHENVYMPMLIPESLLQKEKDHVEGFAPEVAWVTHGGSEELAEKLCVRPTSETLFCEHYAHVVQSWRDLPKLYNQWCSVVRWEKTTRPFLRSREFLWQEGHTIHATAEEAQEETLRMLQIYTRLCEDYLAMPVVSGRKTESEKFAGAIDTYTIECMMHDGKSLQSGTTHFFGDGFARAFDIQFTGKDNKLSYPFQTSWGISTRLIGGIIMTHGDNSGLVLPPKIAPIQAVVIPIASHKPGVLDKAEEVFKTLKSVNFRVKLDNSDQSPGWKFSEYEMKGVPLRIEIGPRDLENNECVFASRTGTKKTVSLDGIAENVQKTLDEIQQTLFDNAKKNLDSKTNTAQNFDELVSIAKEKGGFIKSMWCGSEECEDKVREATNGVKPRCLPFNQHLAVDKDNPENCAICGKLANNVLVWGYQY